MKVQRNNENISITTSNFEQVKAMTMLRLASDVGGILTNGGPEQDAQIRKCLLGLIDELWEELKVLSERADNNQTCYVSEMAKSQRLEARIKEIENKTDANPTLLAAIVESNPLYHTASITTRLDMAGAIDMQLELYAKGILEMVSRYRKVIGRSDSAYIVEDKMDYYCSKCNTRYSDILPWVVDGHDRYSEDWRKEIKFCMHCGAPIEGVKELT